MDSSDSTRIYKFEELFFTMFKIRFVRRRTDGAALELCRVKFMIFGMTMIISLTLGMIARLLEFVYDSHLEWEEMSANAQIVSVSLIASCRGLTLLANLQNINNMLKKLESLFPVTRRSQMKYHLPECAQEIIRKNKIMRMLVTVSCIGYLGMPFMQSLFDWAIRRQEFTYRYPVISWYPINEKRALWYPVVYCYQLASCCSAALFYFNEDFFFLTPVAQISMHYKYLCSQIKQLDARSESRDWSHLKKLIQYQYVLEGLQDDVNKIFSVNTFIAFTIVKVSICMFMFSFFHGTTIGLNDLSNMFCLLSLIVPIYLRCTAGMDIFEANANLNYSIYEHNWYEGTPNYRKMVTIMMIKGNRPAALQASQLRQISIQYFMEIMLETYQIFTFLYNFSN